MSGNEDISLSDFFSALEIIELGPDAQQKEQFSKYYELLIQWNSKINLIGRNEKNIVDRHFLNSVSLACFRKFQPTDRIIDLGSGGGFPGILLKILFPASLLFLIESVRKKSVFLNEVAVHLNLKNLVVVNNRIENLSASEDYRNNFNYVTARAVAPMKKLIPLAATFIKREGEMLFLKGKNFQSEIDALEDEGRDFSFIIHSLNESTLFRKNQEGVLIIARNKY
jgi:16S rRNA (guanine527-N7)-methyltransferase